MRCVGDVDHVTCLGLTRTQIPDPKLTHEGFKNMIFGSNLVVPSGQRGSKPARLHLLSYDCTCVEL